MGREMRLNISPLAGIPNIEFKLSSLIFYDYSIDFLLDYLKNKRSIKVLDIGCSSGYGIYIMAKNVLLVVLLVWI